MTYKNMQVGDVVQQGEHSEDPYVIKAFEKDEHGRDAIRLHRTQGGTRKLFRPANVSTEGQLHPWCGAVDLDVEVGDQLTPEWEVAVVDSRNERVRLQNTESKDPTNWMDIRVCRLPEKVWLIRAIAEWQQVWQRNELKIGAVVKRKTKAVSDYYPWGVVVEAGKEQGFWVECKVLFGNEQFKCLAEELDVVAPSMIAFSAELAREQKSQEDRLRDRDMELEEFKAETARVIASWAAENNWEDVDSAFAKLDLTPPNPRVEFELTITVRLLATRAGGDPGDELKKSFLANSFMVGLRDDEVEGFGVAADADLKDVEIVAGSATFEVDHIEREQ